MVQPFIMPGCGSEHDDKKCEHDGGDPQPGERRRLLVLLSGFE